MPQVVLGRALHHQIPQRHFGKCTEFCGRVRDCFRCGIGVGAGTLPRATVKSLWNFAPLELCPFPQHLGEELPRERFLLSQVFWSAHTNDLASVLPTTWAKFNDVIRDFEDVKVVFDDQHRVALHDQFVERFQQNPDVLKVQSGRRFIENVERVARGFFSQLRGEFHTLRFSSGKRRGGLPKPDVA